MDETLTVKQDFGKTGRELGRAVQVVVLSSDPYCKSVVTRFGDGSVVFLSAFRDADNLGPWEREYLRLPPEEAARLPMLLEEKKETYNGNWPNKPTWLVFTRITDEGGYIEQLFRNRAKQTTEALRIEVEEWLDVGAADEFLSPGARDLLCFALDTVDWNYLAEKLREE